MLVIDAWFDVVTSRGDELVTAVLMAVLVELPGGDRLPAAVRAHPRARAVAGGAATAGWAHRH
jgi:hypothetical protein